MSENSAIEWTDATFNPWEGCQKVGPGCDNCYAETRNARFGGGTAINWGIGAPRRRTSAANWAKPLAWNRRAQIMHDAWAIGVGLHGGDEAACIAAGFLKPIAPKVFCASLADVFDNAIDPAWRTDLLDLIAKTPRLDWLLLTKRIGNAAAMVPDGWFEQNPHVMLGATIVNQEEADRDIPKLLAVPAARRFLSMEPLLGPVDLRLYMGDFTQYWNDLDWIIVGGESGAKARPMHVEWARNLRDQCISAGKPFMFKQWGKHMPVRLRPELKTMGDEPGCGETPDGIFHLTILEEKVGALRVGKKRAGRLLDGRTWDEYPERAP